MHVVLHAYAHTSTYTCARVYEIHWRQQTRKHVDLHVKIRLHVHMQMLKYTTVYLYDH